jgi:hypothetical protein
MALFLLENRDFLGFRTIFKVLLNQMFSNFDTMLYTIKYRLSSIMVYFTFTVHKLWSFLVPYKRKPKGTIVLGSVRLSIRHIKILSFPTFFLRPLIY